MRRSDQPSRPRAKTCCFFSSFKTLAMPPEPTSLRGIQCPGRLLSLAGFQVIITGRFWVSLRLQQQPQLHVVGEASDGLQAVQIAEGLQPDIVVLDIGLPKLNGIEAARRIREVSPESKNPFYERKSIVGHRRRS